MIYVQSTITQDMMYVFSIQLFKNSEDPVAHMICTHKKTIDLLQRKVNMTVPM